MSLPKKLCNAVRNNEIIYPFSQNDFTEWINQKEITKDDGTPYEKSTIESYCNHNDILSSSTTRGKGLVSIPNTDPRLYILKEDLDSIFQKING
ncbi:hypothetical protein [Turicibacter sanguinis]|uniref:hypothetical protein n=1 Tax=Turicibacter sanguinis TaxID=154288 RepID=UPI002330A397|nr:hypothetical protein [Turicibacter sanguinis]MDB8575619.1 hypothetical protein [Turicibacter sanguinis]MDB8578745.1 hypothetical protein [Turicibacter sanguinis]MDB8584068.1 hypothetical protein [Turicibacter sanguinis]MDB8588127.1 hypothetical protein [Turicibacter sanguinis]MDB8598135.1 hypothetical protein [Turicibacter sanguinis]